MDKWTEEKLIRENTELKEFMLALKEYLGIEMIFFLIDRVGGEYGYKIIKKEGLNNGHKKAI